MSSLVAIFKTQVGLLVRSIAMVSQEIRDEAHEAHEGLEDSRPVQPRAVRAPKRRLGKDCQVIQDKAEKFEW